MCFCSNHSCWIGRNLVQCATSCPEDIIVHDRRRRKRLRQPGEPLLRRGRRNRSYRQHGSREAQHPAAARGREGGDPRLQDYLRGVTTRTPSPSAPAQKSLRHRRLALRHGNEGGGAGQSGARARLSAARTQSPPPASGIGSRPRRTSPGWRSSSSLMPSAFARRWTAGRPWGRGRGRGS